MYKNTLQLLSGRVASNAREDLFLSLLGKCQTFYHRQRVGDIMARATNDITTVDKMIMIGFDLIFDSFTRMAVTLVFIGLLD